MKAQKLPMNIDLLVLSKETAERLGRIEVLDINEIGSKNFHPKGLFSTEIFGKVGDPKRESAFAYIELNIDVFHPFIYKTLVKLKALYGEIIAGKAYAIFDPKTKDFVRSNPMEGRTGFNFFVENFHNLDLTKNDSIKRDYYVDLIEKYKDRCMLKHLLVLPAGLRDIEPDKNGKLSENEINRLYRKVLGYANLIKDINVELNIDYIDNIRYNMQNGVLEIYTYIKEMLEGKRGMIQDKWASRKVFNSTRNVITSYVPDIVSLDDKRKVNANQSVVGLYQLLKAIFPLSAKLVRDEFLYKVFPGSNTPFLLVNKKTLKKEMVTFNSKLYDEWMTVEGIEKKFNIFSRDDIRSDILEVDEYYLGLIYKGNDGTYKFIQSIDEVPEDRLKNGVVEPMTYAELLMLSVYKYISDIPVFVTRYPITEYGSIYPGFMYLKSTVKGEIRTELDDNWNPTEFTCTEFPIKHEKFFDSIALAPKHLGRLDADFDGDTVSFTCVLSEEAKKEIKNKLDSREFYINEDGKPYFSGETDITNVVLGTLTS
jgi:hypothetical protein